MSCISQGVDWQKPNYGRGINDDLKDKIRSGEVRFDYPCPEPESDLFTWAISLDPKQTFQAFYDYHDKWTWETGCFYDKEILDILEAKIKREYNRPAEEGMVYFDTDLKTVYIYMAGDWHAMSRDQVLDD